MAEETEIDPLFQDCAHGAVPPLGHCYEWTTASRRS
jgi:Ala-tRNA(Pro) deacylase